MNWQATQPIMPSTVSNPLAHLNQGNSLSSMNSYTYNLPNNTYGQVSGGQLLTGNNYNNLSAGQPNTAMQSLSQAWQNNPLGVIGQGASAFGTLASIYSGFKALDLAEDQFKFTKKAWNKNYNNQVKDYQNNLRSAWAARDSAADARGKEFESMGNWVGSRELTGNKTRSVGGDYESYRASSPQSFYSRRSEQENKPIRRGRG